MEPPKAKRIPHQTTVHGDNRVDPYFWLRNKEDGAVIEYLKAENEYTKFKTTHTKGLQESLYKEMVGRIKETDLSVPEKKGDYYYYTRTEEGKNYPIYCRKPETLEADEEILLDGNVLSEGKPYFQLGAFAVSENHQLLAYSVDFDGSEYYDIYVKDLKSGELLTDMIPKTAGNLVWANDDQTFFYVKMDETHRPYRLFRHHLGEAPDADSLIIEEPDGLYYMYATKTKSLDYIFIYLGSKRTTEVHYIDANKPDGPAKIFAKRQKGEEYKVEHHENTFYIVTNDGALNFKVMQTATGQTERAFWTPFIPHDNQVLILSIEAFKNYLVLYTRKNGYKAIIIIDPASKNQREVAFPEPVYTYWKASNPDYHSDKLRFTYSSLITPRTVYDYEMGSGEWIKLKEYEVQGDYDKSEFVTERRFAVAPDGQRIPISIAYRKGIKLDGSAPAYLYGYGSYGHSMDPYFSTVRLSLLERGFVYAMAHVRGGSEMGRQWYEGGKFLQKKNTFTDFIACAEYLVKAGFTRSDQLVISGGSAGGLLVGAVMNMRPDLFHVVVANVPFVDVVNTMLDETIPLTVTEYEEWGNPNDEQYYLYMKSYSPYDNVKPTHYPHILITAGLNDPRVQYWEPAKWTALLRSLKTDNNTLLLKTNMGAGHSGASGRYETLKELAFEYAFILDKTGKA